MIAKQTPPVVVTGLEDEIDIDGMTIVKRSEINVVRQMIRLDAPDMFIVVLTKMWGWMRIGKFTGKIYITMNQGGVQKIETEQDVK